ncbi:sensor histidine kinase [Salibacterium sp. K-3]
MSEEQINDKEEDLQKTLIHEERKRFARDLHDSVNQKLFSLSLLSRGLSNNLSNEDENVRKGIQDIEKLAQEALFDLRNLIWQYQPVDTEQDFLDLLKEYGKKVGLNVTIECYGEDIDLSEHYVEAMLRIGQEALNNVRKHSGADQAFIQFDINHHDFKLEIADQGCGFKTNFTENQHTLFGITGMIERASQIGGEIRVSSSPGSGTVVCLFVPIQADKRRKP